MNDLMRCFYCERDVPVSCGNIETRDRCFDWRSGVMEGIRQRVDSAFGARPATFAPDERPYEPVEPDAPFTPEQERRLREIAWGANVAFAKFVEQRTMGIARHAEETRRAFLEGGDA